MRLRKRRIFLCLLIIVVIAIIAYSFIHKIKNNDNNAVEVDYLAETGYANSYRLRSMQF